MVLEDGRIESAGNFHGAPLGLACDLLAIAAAEVGAIAERRTDRLLDASRSHGLPPFLAGDPGVDLGLMIAHYTQAAMVAENRRLAAPASVEPPPTSATTEDDDPRRGPARKGGRATGGGAAGAPCPARPRGAGPRPARPARAGARHGSGPRACADRGAGPRPRPLAGPGTRPGQRLVESGVLVEAVEAAIGGLE